MRAINELRNKLNRSVPVLWRKALQRLQYTNLYPNIAPHDSGMLDVSPVHRIYYEQSGNPRGKPVIFLHGGPGGGTTPAMRRYFNPRKYRIVLFDQRGSGRSRPLGSLEDNTTWHLVEDIEALREHLGIEAWMVFGGSWGATLALAYAQKHPERVTEMILRGIFLASAREIGWFYKRGGASAIFPDAWQLYESVIPPQERNDLLAAYYRRLQSEDEKERLEAARAWSRWEAATSHLVPDPELEASFTGKQFAQALARIECHYFINRAFLEPESQLLDGIDRIRSIPAVIVQGRYDVICPMETAWRLHERWPEARFIIADTAGHSGFEPAIRHHLVRATDAFSHPHRRTPPE